MLATVPVVLGVTVGVGLALACVPGSTILVVLLIGRVMDWPMAKGERPCSSRRTVTVILVGYMTKRLHRTKALPKVSRFEDRTHICRLLGKSITVHGAIIHAYMPGRRRPTTSVAKRSIIS